ncbi:MAG: hypothetical protein H6653_04715 [Ardenticatenaceae bacterium]|nr:hypothetical protein [Ardenticatenaceae bacterium]
MLGALTVTESLIFDGNSAVDTIIDAQGVSGVFNVTAGTATFNNLTIQGGDTAGSGGGINATGGGSLILNSTVITGNNATSNGGGIAFTNGSLTLNNSQIISNTAGSSGGGIFSNNGAIALTNSQVLTNTAVGNGGGIAVNLAGASLIMNSGQIQDNTANTTSGFPGGGIYVAQGSATIHDGEISGNAARRGGGILVSSGSLIVNGGQIINNEAAYGGGIYARNTNATVTINDGLISQNRSIDPVLFGGGGLYIFQGQITMNGGQLSQNTALNDGGGLEIGDPVGRFVQTGGEIFSNSAGNIGGAIHNSQGIVNISGGMIYANNSGTQGGGIYAAANSSTTLSNSAILTNTSTIGGGIHNLGTLTMTNVTMSDNSASSGAGLSNGGTAVLTNVTISDNTASNNGGGVSSSGGTLTVGNSIIFGNSAPLGADCNGTVTSAGNNISSCGNGDLNSDPLLQPLALNGGDSLNFALGAGSPAIDAGSNTLCPSADQRGNLRPVGGTCDIGAYEDGIGFFINDVTLSEGDAGATQMNFTVTRSFITDTTYTVDYETFDDTALAGLDYTAISNTLTFLPGDMTQTVTVDILGDTLDENDELFTVTLSNPSGGSQLGNTSGTGTILDDDAPPSLTINDVTIDPEGNSGTVTAVFTATLSAPSGKTITVDYATLADTAEAGSDYVTASGTLTFVPGDVEESFSITINADTLDEFDETFTVELSNETNLNLTDSSALVTIVDDDLEPEINIGDVTVTEGDSGTTTADFTVTLSAPSGKTITVDYATADGTATAGSDYVTDSGMLTFAPGDTSKTISITINGDVVDEVNETYLVNLSNESNATLADSQATGTITDDDPLPTATISDATVIEGDSGTVTAVFTVTLSATSEKVITIDYSSADDSATAGEDYTAVPASTLTFNPGESLSQTISVTINGDEDTEPDEQFFINLTGSSNVTLASTQAVGTITNDDGTFIFLPFIVKP